MGDGGPSAPLASAARTKKLEVAGKHKRQRGQANEAQGQCKMAHDPEQHAATQSQTGPVCTSEKISASTEKPASRSLISSFIHLLNKCQSSTHYRSGAMLAVREIRINETGMIPTLMEFHDLAAETENK